MGARARAYQIEGNEAGHVGSLRGVWAGAHADGLSGFLVGVVDDLDEAEDVGEVAGPVVVLKVRVAEPLLDQDEEELLALGVGGVLGARVLAVLEGDAIGDAVGGEEGASGGWLGSGHGAHGEPAGPVTSAALVTKEG